MMVGNWTIWSGRLKGCRLRGVRAHCGYVVGIGTVVCKGLGKAAKILMGAGIFKCQDISASYGGSKDDTDSHGVMI